MALYIPHRNFPFGAAFVCQTETFGSYCVHSQGHTHAHTRTSSYTHTHVHIRIHIIYIHIYIPTQIRVYIYIKITYNKIYMYVGHLESKERLRIQPAQLFNFS